MSNLWWKNSVGYQIYIRSFFDSNNDGIGDINGITEKLDYIKKLGIDFIWICPFYDSPMDDNGYDIRDYYKIDNIYGNSEDLKRLIKEAHYRDIKVIIDLVLNHTSDEHEWFIKSENNIEPYTDFYIWKNPKNNKRTPPNNWVSFFSGSAWKYSEKRSQYYLRIFSSKMPDLNFENQNLYMEIEKIIKYYSDLKIDGFRVDAISHIGKNLTYKNAKNIKKSYKNFSNLPNTHIYLKKMNKIFTKYNLASMGELGGNPTKNDILKYTTENELDLVFTFEQSNIFNKNKTINISKLLKVLKFKNSICESGGHSALFWLNHDYPRIASKIENEEDTKGAMLCLASLMYFLKGTPIIYNGEEIGMTNYQFEKPSDFKDINAKMLLENSKNQEKTLKYLKDNSRDNSRTVMQWSDEKFSGFSSNVPWTYVNKNYKDINVKFQINDNNSIFSNYCKIISLRKKVIDLIINGNYKFIKKNKIIGYTISYKNNSLTILSNLGNKEKEININHDNILYTNKVYKDKILPYMIIIFKS